MDKAKREGIKQMVMRNGGIWHESDGESVSVDIFGILHDVSRAEFEQVKAEEQNKPSWDDAPEWAEWLAQGSRGEWDWYEHKPQPIYTMWDIPNKECNWNHESTGKVIGDWRNTLEKRPTEIDSGQNDPESPFYADNCINTSSNSPSVRFAGCVMPDGLYKPNLGAEPMKYQYGVEYECDGVKPDLDDDVKIICYSKDINKWMLHRGYTDTVGSIKRWDGENGGYHITKFCIVDERYKPKPNLDELSAKESTPELRELMRGDWHERGELPPVGERCRCNTMDYGWQECDVLSDDNINGFDVMVCRIEPDGCLQYVAAHEFKPLRTEEDELLEQAHIDSENDQWLFSKRELVRRLIRKGWRPPKN